MTSEGTLTVEACLPVGLHFSGLRVTSSCKLMQRLLILKGFESLPDPHLARDPSTCVRDVHMSRSIMLSHLVCNQSDTTVALLYLIHISLSANREGHEMKKSQAQYLPFCEPLALETLRC